MRGTNMEERGITGKIAFDTKLRRPGCTLVQAAAGVEPYVALAFPSETWLLSWTPDMKVYPLQPGMLESLVKIAVEATETERRNDGGKKRGRGGGFSEPPG